MENISRKLANYILSKGIIAENSLEIYIYGFQCFLEISASFICSIFIALYFNMLLECLYFFLFFIPLRSFGGGFHMKTYTGCFIGSCLILVTTFAAVKYFTVPLGISFGLYAVSAILSLIIGPVDHPNRKVEAHESHLFVKKTNITMLFSFLFAIIFIACNNARYMFLQALLFVFIFSTSLIGRLLYRPT